MRKDTINIFIFGIIFVPIIAQFFSLLSIILNFAQNKHYDLIQTAEIIKNFSINITIPITIIIYFLSYLIKYRILNNILFFAYVVGIILNICTIFNPQTITNTEAIILINNYLFLLGFSVMLSILFIFSVLGIFFYLTTKHSSNIETIISNIAYTIIIAIMCFTCAYLKIKHYDKSEIFYFYLLCGWLHIMRLAFIFLLLVCWECFYLTKIQYKHIKKMSYANLLITIAMSGIYIFYRPDSKNCINLFVFFTILFGNIYPILFILCNKAIQENFYKKINYFLSIFLFFTIHNTAIILYIQQPFTALQYFPNYISAITFYIIYNVFLKSLKRKNFYYFTTTIYTTGQLIQEIILPTTEGYFLQTRWSLELIGTILGIITSSIFIKHLSFNNFKNFYALKNHYNF